MNKFAAILLIALLIVSAGIFVAVSCNGSSSEEETDPIYPDDDDTDDDDLADDDDDDTSDDDWYSNGSDAYDNCISFYTYYFLCFDKEPDQSLFASLCNKFTGWEGLYSGDTCMEEALDAFWQCLLGLDCTEYDSSADYGNAAAACDLAYDEAIEECGSDDDDDDVTDDDDDDDNIDDDDDDDDDDDTADVWTKTTIDTDAKDSSIWVDDSGYVHISYQAITNEDLMYASNKTGSWATTTVDSAGSVGQGSSIGVDSNGKVHIVYFDTGNTKLKYATDTTGSWIKSDITNVTSCLYNGCKYTSLDIDTNNKVHAAYQFYNVDHDLFYATNSSGSWNTQALVDWQDIENDIVLKLNGSNKAYVKYWSPSNADRALKYIENSAGTWQAHFVFTPAGNEYVRANTMAMDAGGDIHFGYFMESAVPTYCVYYSGWSGSAWTQDAVDCLVYDIFWAMDMVVDNNGHVHYAYHDFISGTNDKLKYASNKSGWWDGEIIDNDTPTGWDPHIAVDSNNYVHISYDHYADHSLRYITNKP